MAVLQVVLVRLIMHTVLPHTPPCSQLLDNLPAAAALLPLPPQAQPTLLLPDSQQLLLLTFLCC